MSQGIVFNIQRFTINDGPGIRTEVFMKGCPLACKWCSNPESQNPHMEPGVYPSKCLSEAKCGLCIKACKNNALLFTDEGIFGIDRNKCVGCLQCVASCPSEAIKAWGIRMTVDEVLNVIEKDRKYYEESNGGVTISGGEPLEQPDFVRDILKACKERGIHTCLESTLFASWDTVKKTIEYADIVITDLKHMDSENHKKWTSQGNEKSLENIKKLADFGKDMIVRIPVIPGINDDWTNIEKTADYIIENIGDRLRTLQLLSFMRMGEEKCASLDREYLMKNLEFDRDEFQTHVKEIAEYFNGRGIHCIVGTKEKE